MIGGGVRDGIFQYLRAHNSKTVTEIAFFKSQYISAVSGVAYGCLAAAGTADSLTQAAHFGRTAVRVDPDRNLCA